jgi:ABC-2 type transport system permease protein
MARVFVRLKLRILKNRLSTGGFLSGIGFVILWLAALAGGLGGGLALGVISRGAQELIGPITVLVFATVGLAWIVVPVVIASIDDSLEARTFELLPFTPSQLARGLVVAGLVGPGTIATVLGLGYGSTLAFASAATVVPVVVVALTAVMLCVVAARWATATLSDLLRQRRGQEIALMVVVGLSLFPALFVVTVAESASTDLDIVGALSRVAEIVQWTPWGALGRSVVAIGAGEWQVAMAGFAYGLGATFGALVLFGRSLRRMSLNAPSDVVARAGRVGSRLLPKRIPLPATPVGAVAAKELLSIRRDVRMRSQLLGGIVAILVLGILGGSVVVGTVFAPFLSVLAVFILVTAVTPNQLGYDGGSFWGYLTMAPDLGTVIRGKNLGWAVVCVPLAVLLALAGAVASGHWVYVPAALLGSVVVALIWLGIGNITSIFGAFRLPETNLFGSRNVSGGAFVATMIGISASGLLTLPPLLAVGVLALLAQPLWATVAAAASVAYAASVYRIAVRRAAVFAHDRRFVLLKTLDGE